MFALIKRKNQTPIIENIPEAQGDIILEPQYVGLCRTDLKIANDEIPIDQSITLGHEVCAKIVYSSVKGFNKNQMVVVNPYFDEGFLGMHLNGVIQERFSVPSKQLVKIPKTLNPQIGAFLEPVAAACGVLNQKIQYPLGILGNNRIAELTKIVLKSKNIPFENYNPLKKDYYGTILETNLNNIDFKELFQALKQKGNIIIKSRNNNQISFCPDLLLQKEISISGVFYYDFKKSLQWMIKNQQSLLPLFGQVFHYSQWDLAFSEAMKENKKIFLKFC